MAGLPFRRSAVGADRGGLSRPRTSELALLGVPVFLFQEGEDISAEKAFREIARLTKGAYCRFDAGSAAQLRELLAAVAVYAAGGRKALQALAGHGARRLLRQLE